MLRGRQVAKNGAQPGDEFVVIERLQAIFFMPYLPAPVEPARPKIHAGKGEARPQSEQPAERHIPIAPEPRPQARRPEPHQQAAPAGGQPQPPEPAKGKGKGKDEKKDAGKSE